MVRKPAPCPFCGEALRYVERQSRRFERVVYRAWEHPAVGCILDGADFSPAEIEKWNKRADLPQETDSDPEAPAQDPAIDRALNVTVAIMKAADLCAHCVKDDGEPSRERCISCMLCRLMGRWNSR